MEQNKRLIRKHFNNVCQKRDMYRCRCCRTQIGRTVVHHITDRKEMPYGGYVKENGITLCDECHLKAEQWHRSGNTYFVPGYHPNDLYAIIGSSLNEAFEASMLR